MDKRNYAFGKINFILMAVGMLVVILGFILMSGGGSDETVFDNDIFSVRRIKVAPVVCFLGFISIIYAISKKPKDEESLQGVQLRQLHPLRDNCTPGITLELIINN